MAEVIIQKRCVKNMMTQRNAFHCKIIKPHIALPSAPLIYYLLLMIAYYWTVILAVLQSAVSFSVQEA